MNSSNVTANSRHIERKAFKMKRFSRVSSKLDTTRKSNANAGMAIVSGSYY